MPASDPNAGSDTDGEPSRAAVRRTYEDIGDHFSKTREYAWPEVEAFVDESSSAGTALDVGCGNGRHAELLAEVADRVVGLDASRALLQAATDRVGDSVTLLQGDATRLPLASESVGLAVYVATLHHLPSQAARRASLDELARVLAPGARALVSAWSTAHDRFDADPDADAGFDTTVDWTLPGGETVPRFYHIYTPAEFERDVADSDLRLVSMELSSGNCYGVVEPEGKRT
ncbi:class I SAM-dependent methyltransferase [Haloarcula rubripromontorii]|uniref:Methyltransferase domain-containing protein n=1 Tax=Haloarcula rubripromontorii TaxID=1705562 RepID=A0A0M9AHM1_9EURY|nr:class I SAM-dependent methyltransferase [Haloarcula rubripromontorii]KOX92192.1 SAM-dependent methyltransferase [Haloarcula rubripromontorii]NLV06991.1 methyltransferase domain-containing protein [Haloarcula rubripromontorii]